MKKAVIFFSSFLVSVSLLVGCQDLSTNSELKTFNVPIERTLVTKNASDEKILIVENFWNQALSLNSVNDFIINVPKEFYDDTPRCNSEENKGNSESISIDPKKESGFTRDLMTTAKTIGNEQRVLKKTRLFRQWKSEAIVETEFEQKNKPNILEKNYFFLYLIDGKWKIFLSTSLPDLLNREYAKNGCNQ